MSARMSTSVQLLERARAGSNQALGTLLGRCGPKLLALIRARLGASLRRETESRDLLQSTLLKALVHFEEFRGERGSLMAWLARIAENEIRDLATYHGRARRDAARRVSLDASPEAAFLIARVRSQTSLVAQGERLERVERALETLSAEHREVIVLRMLEERGFAEVAERMGRGPEACRMLFVRAMTALTLATREPT